MSDPALPPSGACVPAPEGEAAGAGPGRAQGESAAGGSVASPSSGAPLPAAPRAPCAGFFYHLAQPCKVKRRLAFEEAVVLLGAPEGLDALVASLRRRTQEGYGPETLVRTVAGAHGIAEAALAVSEALRRGEALLRLRRRCRDCSANFGSPPAGFGCFGFIPIPIPGEAERVLMVTLEHLMADGDVDASAAVPIRHVWDNGLDGEGVRLLRQAGVFATTEAVVTRIGPFLDRRPISSDQLLELFLGTEVLGLEYIYLFQGFLQEFDRLLPVADRIGREAISPLARYFRALLLAADLGVPVHLAPRSDRVVQAGPPSQEG